MDERRNFGTEGPLEAQLESQGWLVVGGIGYGRGRGGQWRRRAATARVEIENEPLRLIDPQRLVN